MLRRSVPWAHSKWPVCTELGFWVAKPYLGSLRKGKLGDLVVLNSNPLADIRNTADIQYVVKGESFTTPKL